MDADIKRGDLIPGFPVTSSDTLVEVGFGEGHACRFAGSLGADVIGLEICPKLVLKLGERMKTIPARSFRAILSDCRPIPLADATADVVVCTEVMEHTDDPHEFLGELYRIGKPGARYYLSVPDPASEQIMGMVSPPSYFQKPNHLHVISRDRLDSMFERAGFEEIRREYTGFYHVLWWAFRMAVGTDYCPGDPGPAPPILADWERVWRAFQATTPSERVIEYLDHLLPKSQRILARKPLRSVGEASRRSASQAVA